MKTVAIVQARMSSTRLPGKILADLGGQPLLYRVVQRARLACALDLVAVATTVEASDEEVARFCERAGIACFRGALEDVLDRYYQAARHFEADVVVRLTGDCPLLDPAVIDEVVRTFRGGAFDYVSNTLEPSYPDGLDTEVFSAQALERAWQQATLASEREHVTPYFRKHPELFRLRNVRHPQDLSRLRWTVDEPADLEFVRRVYAGWPHERPCTMQDVLELLASHSEWNLINAGLKRNAGYQKSLSQDARRASPAGTGQKLYRKAKTRIPGGTQLLSKRPEMHLPELWPSYYSRAAGVEVWDLDGHKYLDMSTNGIGACILGAADPEVNAAVRTAVDAGSMSTLNAPEEVELADLLCELHPWAEMARYARSGGEAMTVAVRIARARTRRDRLAFCGYHGWHDWYLAANLAEEKALDGHLLPGLEPAGVPRGLLGSALPFRYNHLEELEAIVAHAPEGLAAIVMEPIRDQAPAPGFLEGVRDLATRTGAVLIFDEITAGFRLTCGGAHLNGPVMPDMAVFAKAMSNGFPMAAILGRGAVMEAAQTSFISSTYWTDRIGPAAALATIRKHRREKVPEHLVRVGQQVQDAWQSAAAQAGLVVEVGGIYPLSHFYFTGEQKQALRTLFTQWMLERGFLAGSSFYATFAHQAEHVAQYRAALGEVFPMLARAVAEHRVEALLQGPVAHAGFRRLT